MEVRDEETATILRGTAAAGMEDDLVSEDDILLRSEKEFHVAARYNDTEKMLHLINKGVNIKAKNNIGLPCTGQLGLDMKKRSDYFWSTRPWWMKKIVLV